MEFRRVLFRSGLSCLTPGFGIRDSGLVIAGTRRCRIPHLRSSVLLEFHVDGQRADFLDQHVERLRHAGDHPRSEEHTSELQSLMRNSYAVFCLKKKNKSTTASLLTVTAYIQ